ncbi:hypothetical protein [Treponema sp.]|uniref:hypothetical protein n=1 Tax=Treponema sp. TaxID=166 RepID=UPI003FD8D85E
MKVILLSGPKDSGKSTLLMKLSSALSNNYNIKPQNLPIVNFNPGTDICQLFDIISINKKIVIFSEGDYSKKDRVKTNTVFKIKTILNIHIDCDVFICAGQTNNGVDLEIKKYFTTVVKGTEFKEIKIGMDSLSEILAEIN